MPVNCSTEPRRYHYILFCLLFFFWLFFLSFRAILQFSYIKCLFIDSLFVRRLFCITQQEEEWIFFRCYLLGAVLSTALTIASCTNICKWATIQHLTIAYLYEWIVWIDRDLSHYYERNEEKWKWLPTLYKE